MATDEKLFRATHYLYRRQIKGIKVLSLQLMTRHRIDGIGMSDIVRIAVQHLMDDYKASPKDSVLVRKAKEIAEC